MSSLEEKLRLMQRNMPAYAPAPPQVRWDAHAPGGCAAQCLVERKEYPVLEVCPAGFADIGSPAVALLCGAQAQAFALERAIFLDTETTGLAGGAGTVAFLIGVGFVRGDRFITEQYMMQDYDRESPMLARLCERLRGFDTLVSFNGKSFDIPILQARGIINRLRLPFAGMAHIDLLHAARRLYKLRIGRCNLGALEEHILGAARQGDIPGALVPTLFFEYLQSGDFEPMHAVMRHNQEDVLSMLRLLGRMCADINLPARQMHAQDLYSRARLHIRQGDTAQAIAALELCDLPQARQQLMLLYRRAGRPRQALAVCRRMIDAREGALFPLIEAAKLCEHTLRDLPQALAYARRAAGLQARFGAVQAPVQRRVERLQRKLHTTRED